MQEKGRVLWEQQIWDSSLWSTLKGGEKEIEPLREDLRRLPSLLGVQLVLRKEGGNKDLDNDVEEK